MKHFDLEEIKQIIAEKYSWGPSDKWTNFHFKELSKSIENITGDRLSEETLKRIFGKRKVNTENYQPQAFSQLVLIKFVASIGQTTPKKDLLKRQWNKKVMYTLLILILLITMLVILFNKSGKTGYFSFSCRNSIDYLPFTATFEYNISEIEDSVFCDFGINAKKYLPPENSMINYFYKNAGIYNVHFFTSSRVLDSLKIIVCSKDWQGGYFPNDEPEKFKPFYDQIFYRQPDCFYASPEKLKEENVNLKEGYWTTYKLFSLFDKSLDSLQLETHVLNNASTGSYLCYDIDISLIGDSGLIDFKFTQPKCSRFARLRFSEKQMNGEFDKLDAMSVDLSDWLKIKMITKSNNFNLYLADTLIFSGNYERPLGNLLGVVYSFYGSGKIDYLELKEGNGSTFYSNQFALSVPKVIP
jgi:hypothetical protein